MHDIPIMTVEHQNNELKTFTERHISRLLMIFSDAVVVLSPEYLASLKALVGIFWRGDKVHLIPNGIDTVAFAPKPNKQYFAFGRPMRIGMASRFSRIKRHDLLLGALVVLRNRDGTNSWRLSLAGDGETHADICLQAKALDLLEAIELPGYLSEKGLCDWFHSLDFYVHASDGETLSTSLLQAMAMGLPIVGSNVPGIDNLLLAGGGCGLLADLQTPESFAAAITRLATSPALAAELGARARTLAGDEYSQDVMYRRYQEVMHSWLPDHF
jgi:glycosyltransferase involved in cell wall biosynthesis